MFFCLDAKEPKDQGKTDGSAGFARPTHKVQAYRWASIYVGGKNAVSCNYIS